MINCHGKRCEEKVQLFTFEPFFERNFTKVQRLGKGGFGKVWKVLSKDGSEYAVKRVRIVCPLGDDNDDIENSSLREVLLLKNVSGHQNVISYLKSWIEHSSLTTVTSKEECGNAQLVNVQGDQSHNENGYSAHSDEIAANFLQDLPVTHSYLEDFGGICLASSLDERNEDGCQSCDSGLLENSENLISEGQEVALVESNSSATAQSRQYFEVANGDDIKLTNQRCGHVRNRSNDSGLSSLINSLQNQSDRTHRRSCSQGESSKLNIDQFFPSTPSFQPEWTFGHLQSAINRNVSYEINLPNRFSSMEAQLNACSSLTSAELDLLSIDGFSVAESLNLSDLSRDDDTIRFESNEQNLIESSEQNQVTITKNYHDNGEEKIGPTTSSENPDKEASCFVLYIQMPLFDTDLKEYLYSRSAICLSENKFLFKQILSALNHIHDHHIIHRDLKPANIFLFRESKELCIADFGRAIRQNSVDDDSKLSSDVGTTLYMAPEVQGSCYDEKCDLYSAGIVLFELFTVTSASSTADTEANINFMKEQRYLPEHQYSDEFGIAQLILNLTETKPQERPSASNALGKLV